MPPDKAGGLYITARVDADNALALATARAARGKVELWFGCRCYTRGADGTVTGWDHHDPASPATADCPAHPDLPEVLQMLGFLPTTPGRRPSGSKPSNRTGLGRWPEGRR